MSAPTEREIRERIVAEIAESTRMSATEIDVREPFASYNIGSIEAVHMVGVLEDWLGLTLDPTLLWDHPTIDALAKHLARTCADRG